VDPVKKDSDTLSDPNPTLNIRKPKTGREIQQISSKIKELWSTRLRSGKINCRTTHCLIEVLGLHDLG
jgi:hypothetical protein